MQIAEYHKKITSLGSRDITVRVMTPDGYESGAKRYPVVYINDGQDVFRDEDILWGECSMDYENYYRSYGRFLPDMIIVALVCPRDREAVSYTHLDVYKRQAVLWARRRR